jgi:hypothetical protein
MRTTSATTRPEWNVVLPAALLCATVTAIHVLDQGSITAYAGKPWWLGWGYRAVEAGGVLTALLLLTRLLPRLAWSAALLVGLGPFVMYLLTRGVGLPGDPDDKGAWGDKLGTVSLMVEAALILAAVMTIVRLISHAPSRRAIRPAIESHTRERELVGSLS